MQSTELLRVAAASGGFSHPMLEKLTTVSVIRNVVSVGCLQQHGHYKQVILKQLQVLQIPVSPGSKQLARSKSGFCTMHTFKVTGSEMICAKVK
jgi:hypothetical protein